MRKKTPKPRNPEVAREAILRAALAEFAAEGLDGARTDHIARAAGVNKALLYYYFEDKEALYGAVLDSTFGEMAKVVGSIFELPLSPRERLLEYVRTYFRFLAAGPLYPRIIQREMMRSGRTPSPHLKRIFETFMRPTFGRFAAMYQQGVDAGEFRPMDPRQAIISINGAVVFYFISAPGVRIITGIDPLTPAEFDIREHALIDFISHAVFTDKTAGESNKPSPQPVFVPTGRQS